MSKFCRHKSYEVVCWHWTHGPNGNEIGFIEAQIKCNKCGKYDFLQITDLDERVKFLTTENIADKMWSDTCKPML